MKRKHAARATITINAPSPKVWEALTDPALIKQYLFGTEVETDWKEGSPITYRGVWEGRSYVDKGTVLRVKPGECIVTTYWSSMSGTSDAPENYHRVDYKLSPGDGNTTLMVMQDNINSEEAREHSQKNWMTVLKALKELLEG